MRKVGKKPGDLPRRNATGGLSKELLLGKVKDQKFHLPHFCCFVRPDCLRNRPRNPTFDPELLKNFIMKTIVRVIQTGDQKIRFETDLDAKKNPTIIPDLIERFTFAMLTSLWGGNELTVLAIIRALAISDLAVSVNRKEMVRFLDETSRIAAHALNEAKKDFVRSGGKIIDFAPGVMPSGVKS